MTLSPSGGLSECSQRNLALLFVRRRPALAKWYTVCLSWIENNAIDVVVPLRNAENHLRRVTGLAFGRFCLCFATIAYG